MTVYTPIKQMRTMTGKRICFGTFRMLTKTLTRGRFRISSIKLPIYMLAITAQKRSGLSLIKLGPGVKP